MAKFGEGDPRWLVEDRADGANVNNWHWTEKDCLQWSKTRLQELFGNLPLVDGPVSVRCSGTVTVKGEAFLNVRKNKLIPSYELELTVPWEGTVHDGEGKVVSTSTGKVNLPYIADENHDEDPEIRVLCDSSDSASQRCKDAILNSGKKVIFSKVAEYVTELRSGAGTTNAASSQSTTAAQASANGSPQTKPQPQASKPSPSKAQSSTSSLTLKEKYYASVRDLYECFTVEGKMKAFTQSPAQLDPKPGGVFSWYNGTVTGTFVELVPNQKLVMKWRFSSWADECHSMVTLEFAEPEPGNAFITLKQNGIPLADKFGNENVMDVTEQGWKGQVLSRIRTVFGYGV